MSFKWRKIYTYGIMTLVLAVAILYIMTHVKITTLNQNQLKPTLAGNPSPIEMDKGLGELPQESNFQKISETSNLELKVDPTTGHFTVKDKRDGQEYHSYPDPAQWEAETQGGSWRFHLRSPLMLEYMDFGIPNTRPKLTSFIAQVGAIEQFQPIDGGFSLIFNMPAIGVSVPVQVTIKEDYVQTKIVDSELTETSPKLISLRLYPFFNAEHTVANQPDYMFIPDGSGALINFKDSKFATNQIYDQRVYGEDISFAINSGFSNMNSINMPVFGMKSGDRGFVAIIDQGQAYTRILASPAGVYSSYNWITVQQSYRDTFKMVPDKKKPTQFFITYNIDQRFTGDRTIRYYLLNNGVNGYVAMASKFREYLMDTQGLSKLTAKKDIPLDLAIIAAGSKQGFISSETVKETTTSQAMQMIQRLYGHGVNNMSVSYWGWQNHGHGNYGGNFPVDSWVGGNQGMKDFVSFAHSLEIPVYLNIDYSYNNTGKDRFTARNDGARDLSGTLLKFDNFALVSNKFAEIVLKKDLSKYQVLGIDGLELQNTGKYLNSDYNSKYGGTRLEIEQSQIRMLQDIKSTLGNVRGENLNMYALGHVNHISFLPSDYSYNIFSSHSVPFVQIALHGLVQYTSNFINNHEQYKEAVLKDIEFGYNPSFILTWEQNNLKYSTSLNDIYSTEFTDWESQIVEEYQRFNDALGGVQNQFIIDHRKLAAQVYQTIYENGQSIIVNYGSTPYTMGQVNVPALNFTVIKGGDMK